MKSKQGYYFLSDTLISLLVFIFFLTYFFLQGNASSESINPSYGMYQTFSINLNDLCYDSNMTCPSICLFNSSNKYSNISSSYHSLFSHISTLQYLNQDAEISSLLYGNGSCVGLDSSLLDTHFDSIYLFNDTYYPTTLPADSENIFVMDVDLVSYVINRSTNTTQYYVMNLTHYFLRKEVS